MHERCVPAIDAGATATAHGRCGGRGDLGGDAAAVGEVRPRRPAARRSVAGRAAFDGNGGPLHAVARGMSARDAPHGRRVAARARRRGRPLDPIT